MPSFERRNPRAAALPAAARDMGAAHRCRDTRHQSFAGLARWASDTFRFVPEVQRSARWPKASCSMMPMNASTWIVRHEGQFSTYGGDCLRSGLCLRSSRPQTCPGQEQTQQRRRRSARRRRLLGLFKAAMASQSSGRTQKTVKQTSICATWSARIGKAPPPWFDEFA